MRVWHGWWGEGVPVAAPEDEFGDAFVRELAGQFAADGEEVERHDVEETDESHADQADNEGAFLDRPRHGQEPRAHDVVDLFGGEEGGAWRGQNTTPRLPQCLKEIGRPLHGTGGMGSNTRGRG